MRMLLTIALLLPLPASGGAAFDKVTIRLFEQADGPIVPVARRLYSTHFDATRTRMLGVEISASYAAPEAPMTMPVTCTMRRPDGSLAPSERPMSFQLFGGKTESHSANLLWGVGPDEDWQAGSYEIQCVVDEKPIGMATFEIALNPAEVADGEIRVAAVRLFPVTGQLPPRMNREYTNGFVAEETSRIGIEVEFDHSALGRDARIPVECYFFWPDGQTSPPVVLSYEPQPTWAGGYSAGAMGWEQAGNWAKGVYTISCAIRGQPVIVDRFDLT